MVCIKGFERSAIASSAMYRPNVRRQPLEIYDEVFGFHRQREAEALALSSRFYFELFGRRDSFKRIPKRPLCLTINANGGIGVDDLSEDHGTRVKHVGQATFGMLDGLVPRHRAHVTHVMARYHLTRLLVALLCSRYQGILNDRFFMNAIEKLEPNKGLWRGAKVHNCTAPTDPRLAARWYGLFNNARRFNQNGTLHS